MILSWLKLELFRNPVRKLGAKLAEGAFKSIRKKTNYEEYGGMPLLGVNGVCIIAHGASSPVAIKNAIRAAAESITGYLQVTTLKVYVAVFGFQSKIWALRWPLPSSVISDPLAMRKTRASLGY